MKIFLMAALIWISCASSVLAQTDKSKPVVIIQDPPPPAVEYNPKAWKEYSSPEGRFSINFPGTPVTAATTMQTSKGEVTNHSVVLKLPESYYHVSYLDYPSYVDTDEFAAATLQAGREGMLAKNRGMELLGEQEIAQNGFKGSEYSILQDKFSFGIIRAFVVHGRLYELGVLVPADVAFKTGRPSNRLDDRTDFFRLLSGRFFDSFKLLEGVDQKSSAGGDEADEFDRAVQALSKRCPGVLTLVAGSDGQSTNPGKDRVLHGRAIHLATPTYPSIAHSAHAQGAVKVHVIIDCEGNVAAARAVDGNPLLRAAAEKAARESKFEPTTLDGKIVNVSGIIVFNFVAQ